MLCPNENCPDRVKHGVIPEYQPGVTICPVCSTPLEDDEPIYDPPNGAARRLADNPGFVKRLFRRAPLLDLSTAGWIVDTYAWFLQHFGGPQVAEAVQLVEPTDGYFTIRETEEGTVRAIFETVRRLAGLGAWPCRLEAQDVPLPDTLHPGIVVASADPAPLGTFSVRQEWKDGATITYDPRLISRPMELIATFAHELSHYLLATAETPPPGGEEFEEHATDLGSIFLGFGIFACNAAFNFRQYSDGDWIGWRTTGGGYLREDQLSFGLALFLLVHDIPPEAARRHLDPNPRKYLSDALRQLRSADSEIARLKTCLAAEPAAFYEGGAVKPSSSDETVGD